MNHEIWTEEKKNNPIYRGKSILGIGTYTNSLFNNRHVQSLCQIRGFAWFDGRQWQAMSLARRKTAEDSMINSHASMSSLAVREK